jgi:hypothetical protein
MSLEEIGAAFDPPLSRQRVQQIIDKPPREPGRPSKPTRKDTLRRKLAGWERRRAVKRDAGLPTPTEDNRIAILSADLARLK